MSFDRIASFKKEFLDDKKLGKTEIILPRDGGKINADKVVFVASGVEGVHQTKGGITLATGVVGEVSITDLVVMREATNKVLNGLIHERISKNPRAMLEYMIALKAVEGGE